jgi:hypothetical protein
VNDLFDGGANGRVARGYRRGNRVRLSVCVSVGRMGIMRFGGVHLMLRIIAGFVLGVRFVIVVARRMLLKRRRWGEGHGLRDRRRGSSRRDGVRLGLQFRCIGDNGGALGLGLGLRDFRLRASREKVKSADAHARHEQEPEQREPDRDCAVVRW